MSDIADSMCSGTRRGHGHGEAARGPPDTLLLPACSCGAARATAGAVAFTPGTLDDQPGYREGAYGALQVNPISPERLVELLTDRIAALPVGGGGRVRVALDGAPAARPGELADALVEPLRLRGRPVLRVSAADFLRPASLRLEYGRHDPDAYHDTWLDDGALLREVLDPLEPGGSGRVLPSLRDPVTDRATRAPYTELPPGGVLLLDGVFLLGRWLPFELTVHLTLGPGALARRTPAEEQWTLPAFARYDAETAPTTAADLTVRADDPRHPALVLR